MRKYSDSPDRQPPFRPDAKGLVLLAIDSGSPLVSLAVGAGNRVLGSDSFPGGPSSPSLLERIHALLEDTGLRLDDLDGLVGARGPGSFTGLRTGLATLLGLHQAIRAPATAISSFRAMALQAVPADRPGSGTIVAAVDALRGEWYTQTFGPNGVQDLSSPVILPAPDILENRPGAIVAFGTDRLREALDEIEPTRLVEAAPLAPSLLRLATMPGFQWAPESLTEPLYLRPPAATPKARG